MAAHWARGLAGARDQGAAVQARKGRRVVGWERDEIGARGGPAGGGGFGACEGSEASGEGDCLCGRVVRSDGLRYGPGCAVGTSRSREEAGECESAALLVARPEGAAYGAAWA